MRYVKLTGPCYKKSTTLATNHYISVQHQQQVKQKPQYKDNSIQVEKNDRPNKQRPETSKTIISAYYMQMM